MAVNSKDRLAQLPEAPPRRRSQRWPTNWPPKN